MHSKIHKEAICFGDAKQAALFFDRVLPLTLDEIIPSQSGIYGGDGISKHRSERAQLIFGSLLGSKYEEVLLQRSGMLKMLHDIYSHDERRDGSFSEYLANNYNKNKKVLSDQRLRTFLDPLIKQLGFSGAPVVFPEAMISSEVAGDDDNSVSIFNLPLIDADLVPWEQIIELRNDTARAAKLRNLRIFFERDLDGKSKEYIEDSLSKAVDDYITTLDNHGFETKSGAWSILFSKESAFGYGAAAMLSTLFGMPVAAVPAGAVLNIANICLYLRKRKYEFASLKENHDVAYLVDTQSKLTGSVPFTESI